MPDALAAATIGHLVGDFLLQNDWMAKYKKTHSGVCLVHVLVYTFVVMGFTHWWQASGCLWVALSIAVPHFLIDRGSFVRHHMDLMGQREFRDGALAPWSSIVVDNSIHLFCLYVTALFVSGLG